MGWMYLIAAGIFEVAFTTCLSQMKASGGGAVFALWLGGFLVSITASMGLLYAATLTLPLGTAYAIWTGIGAAGTVLIGILFFREPADFWRVFFISTLVLSVVGLKVAAGGH